MPKLKKKSPEKGLRDDHKKMLVTRPNANEVGGGFFFMKIAKSGKLQGKNRCQAGAQGKSTGTDCLGEKGEGRDKK